MVRAFCCVTKVYTTMLILVTRFTMYGDRIFIVVPHQLIFEWIEVFENSFSITYTIVTDKETLDSINNSDNESIIITSYNFTKENYDEISEMNFDVVAYDEAHKIPKNKDSFMYKAMNEIRRNAFKLLLTSTPMGNSITHLHNLITFIDDTILEDEESFYKKYLQEKW